MPMTQTDIRSFYQRYWKEQGDRAHTTDDLASSSPIEDRVMYPLYARLLRQLAVRVDGGRVLDIGCGSGRWIRFFLENFRPAFLRGMDVTPQSIELPQRWHPYDWFHLPGCSNDAEPTPDADAHEQHKL